MNGSREIVEEPEFSEQLCKLGDVKDFDEACTGLFWGLSTDPYDFDLIPGFETLRIAHSDAYERNGRVVPRVSIIFRISKNKVHLLWVELIRDE